MFRFFCLFLVKNPHRAAMTCQLSEDEGNSFQLTPDSADLYSNRFVTFFCAELGSRSRGVRKKETRNLFLGTVFKNQWFSYGRFLLILVLFKTN